MTAAGFSFRRFVGLLARSLEVATVVALIFRTVAFVVWVRSGGDAFARTVLDDASNFLFLVIMLLLLVDLVRIILKDHGAVFGTLRAFGYLVLFSLSPYPLGAHDRHAGSNQSLQLTAGWRDDQI